VFARLNDVSPWADRGVKEARFYVLRYTHMPAILIEADFVTNTEAETAKLHGEGMTASPCSSG